MIHTPVAKPLDRDDHSENTNAYPVRARDISKPASSDDFVFAHCAQAARDDLPASGQDFRHSYRTLCADLGIEDGLVRILQGRAPCNQSEDYITNLVLAAGRSLRREQRRISKRTIQLLGADPTK